MKHTVTQVLGRRQRAAAAKDAGASIGEVAQAIGSTTDIAARVLHESTDPRKPRDLAWADGLTYLMAIALDKAGFTSREQVRHAIITREIEPDTTPGIGAKGWATLCAWADAAPAPGAKAPVPPNPKAIHAARKVLERAGWTLIPPPEA